ncbi:hypothetical protein BJ165DRAFT_624460 [Panaeolus papilionaceus]|nr:hypothetical protein BJ165DRAFT_624460 [Panaeolus papilionaceus]
MYCALQVRHSHPPLNYYLAAYTYLAITTRRNKTHSSPQCYALRPGFPVFEMTGLSLTSFLGLVAVVLFFTAKTETTAVTIYAVNILPPDLPSTFPTPVYSVEGAGTLIWSAVGTLESGVTEYEVQNVQRLTVVHGLTETRTLFSEPVAVTYTVEQGDTIHRQFVDPAIGYATLSGSINPKNSWQLTGLEKECTSDSDKKKAVCVDEWLHPDLTATVVNRETVAATLTHTLPTTYTGDITPVATLPKGGAKRLSGANIAAAGVVLFGMAMGVYLV